jgi:hypothetical protein
MYFFKYFVSSSKKSKYMDLTVKTPLVIKPHTKTCFSLLSWTTISCCNSCSHNLQRFSIKVRQKVMFSGVLFSTLAMVTCDKGWPDLLSKQVDVVEGYGEGDVDGVVGGSMTLTNSLSTEPDASATAPNPMDIRNSTL